LLAGCSSATGGTDVPATAVATTCPESSSIVSVPEVNPGGGQTTALAAALHFAKHGNIGGIPTTGWRVVVQTHDGAYLRSGDSIIHVVHAGDGTWVADREQTCRS
jgi:hypothetical protein